MSGTLAFWNTEGQSYTAGTTLTYPTFDIVDVTLGAPVSGSTVVLPTTLNWTARNAKDAYSVRIFSGNSQVLESNDLGNATSYTIAAGLLANGQYAATILVRQAGVGNGESASAFNFAIGATAASPPPTSATPTITPGGPPPPPPPPGSGSPTAVTTSVVLTLNDLRIFKTVDRGEAGPGETLRYTINVLNAGTTAATGIRLTDDIPTGLVLDPTRSTTSLGTLEFRDKSVTINLGTLAPGASASILLTVAVNANGGVTINNSARLVWDQVPAGVTSNNVQVTITGAGTPRPGTTSVTNTLTLTPRPQATVKPGSTGGGSTSTIPKTGGEFPLIGLLLGLALLVTRQLRLRRPAEAGDRA
jgi:uncharacterized repeat protein (TIGR01451 family)